MDDIGPAPIDASQVEVWIQRELRKSQLPAYIADELLKKWDASALLIDAKNVVARFCFLNGFFHSLLRILKLDLRSGSPIPWASVLEILTFSRGDEQLSKKLSDSLLAGATRDKQLHTLSALAVQRKESDPRWKNVLESEQKDRLAAVKEEREKLYKDVQIFRAERMDADVVLALTRILTLFPDDFEAKAMYAKMGEQELVGHIDKLKERYQKEDEFLEEEPQWPELEKKLAKLTENLSLEDYYNFSIALAQMGFNSMALQTLRKSVANWTLKEKLWEVEILLSMKAFAEALNTSQIILNENRSDSTVIKTCLYYSAKAYKGLGDEEQAASILKGITAHDPHFRDAAILLVEWTDR